MGDGSDDNMSWVLSSFLVVKTSAMKVCQISWFACILLLWTTLSSLTPHSDHLWFLFVTVLHLHFRWLPWNCHCLSVSTGGLVTRSPHRGSQSGCQSPVLANQSFQGPRPRYVPVSRSHASFALTTYCHGSKRTGWRNEIDQSNYIKID